MGYLYVSYSTAKPIHQKILMLENWWPYKVYHQKKKKKNTDIPPIRICVNKIGIRVAFKINAGYINELLMPIILKLFKSLKNKKNKNWENVTHLGTT